MSKTFRVNPVTLEESREGIRRSGNKRKLIAEMKDKRRRQERKKLNQNEPQISED